MIFSKNEITTAFTIEKCDGCKKESKREFTIGDFLFKKIKICTSCKKDIHISKIFGESTKL